MNGTGFLRIFLPVIYIFLFFSSALGFSEIGKFNDNFSYRHLKIKGPYLSGEVTNISSVVQKNVTIGIDGFDFMNRQLWTTTVYVGVLSPNKSMSINEYIGSQKERTAKLKFKVTGDEPLPSEGRSSAPEKRRPSFVGIHAPAQTSGNGYLLQISGVGPQMSDFFTLCRGVNKFSYKYSGKSNYIITLYRESGEYKELVANDVGQIMGSKGVNIETEGRFYVNVNTDSQDEWSIKIERPCFRDEKDAVNYEKTLNEKYKMWTDKDGVVHIEECR